MCRLAAALLLVVALALPLAACGVKGPPVHPDDSEFPRTYPAR